MTTSSKSRSTPRRAPKPAPKSAAKSTAKPKLSNKDKSEALSVYVNQLVAKKLLSTKKDKRLNKDDYIKTLCKIMSVGINWVTFTSLKFRVLRLYKAAIMKNPPPPNSDTSITAASSNSKDTPVRKIGGRPKGTSLLDISIRNDIEALARKDITVMYNKALGHSDNNRNRLANGTYAKIFNKVKSKYNLGDNFCFTYKSCMMRIYRGKTDSICKHLESPLKDVEERFVQIILALADIGCPITVGETINLIQALIEGTQAQKKLIEYQRLLFSSKGYDDFSVVNLGRISRSYYYNFMKRHGAIIDSNKGRRFEAMRTKWLLYRNFLHMYYDIEKIMVDARVASRLPGSVWMDDKANIVDDVSESYGCKVDVELNFPQCCIVMDEVGGDLNMLNDRHQGGSKYICRKGETPKINATKKSKKFTVLGLTTLRGDPLMCVIILEGKERNVFMESGVDPFHPLNQSFQGDIANSNVEILEDNYGPGRLFPGGPTCEFEGTEVPAMIRYSEKGGINAEILTDILRTLDSLKIYQVYCDNQVVPFLLLDGHMSSFSPIFLEYITNPAHLWKVSIGVPYRTSLWQVGDSYQQNGRFKIALADYKKRLMDKRLLTFCSEIELIPTDIIPMIHEAWLLSFADVGGNKQAILERGFNPLNKNLLLDDTLRRTMTDYDKEEENSREYITVEKLECIANKSQAEILCSTLSESSSLTNSHLNFNHAYSSLFIDKLVGHADVEKARARNKYRANIGNNTKELLKQVKKLTSAGELVKVANTHEIGLDLLTEVRRRKAEVDAAMMEKSLKKMKERYEVLKEYVAMTEEKTDKKLWTSKELKTAIKALKVDSDGKVPTLKKDLVIYYERIKGRKDNIVAEYNGHSCNGSSSG